MKVMNIFIIGVVMSMFLMGNVVAQGVFIPSDADNWLGRLISKIKYSISSQGPFTVYGDELGCSQYPDDIITMKKDESVTFYASDYGVEFAFINLFRGSPNDGTYPEHPGDSRQFIGEGYIYESFELGVRFITFTCDASTAYWNGDCYVDVYKCSENPCYEDSDCDSGKYCEKEVLSQPGGVPDAGVCKVSNPTHTTEVYRCSDGEKTSLGSVSFGSNNFCNNPNARKYLIGTTDQCLTYEPATCSCVPDWSCGSWGDCADDVQTRTCTDSNSCNSNVGRPELSKGCESGSNGDIGDLVIDNINLPERGESRDAPTPREFSVRIKNEGDVTRTVYVEAGFYTQDYATDTACLFSVFPQSLFSAYSEDAPNCVGNEGFVKTKEVTIEPGSKITVKINQAPLYAFVALDVGKTYVLKDVSLVSFLGVYESCCQRLSPDPCSGCVEGTGGYLAEKVDPTFSLADEFWGFNQEITCDAEVYGEIDYKWNPLTPDTIKILRDYRECISYTFYTENGTVNETLTDENTFKLEDIKKLALTKDKIETATSQELLASACLQSNECGYPVTNESDNYDISCVSITNLREEGLISEAKEDNFYDNVGTIIKGTSYGAAGGVVACAVGWGAAGFLVGGPAGATVSVVSLLAAASTTLTGCGALGALIGGVGTSVYLEVTQDDDLLKELEAKNSDAVGICTVEPKSDFVKYFEWAAWFDINGDGKKDGTDGMIIALIGGFLLVLLLMKRQ